MNIEKQLSKLLSIYVLLGLFLFSFNIFMPRNNLVLLYDSKRYFVCSIVIFSSLLLIFSAAVRANVIATLSSIPKNIQLLIGITFLFASISNIVSDYFWIAQLDFFFTLTLLLTAPILMIYISDHKSQLLVSLVWISLLLMLSIALMIWLQVYFTYPLSVHSVFGFANIRFLNRLHIWLIIPALYLYLIARTPKARTLLKIVLSIDVALLIITDVRGAAIALTGGIVLLIWLEPKKRQQILTIVMQAILIGYAIKLLFLYPIPSMLFSDQTFELGSIRTSSSGRWDIWQEVLSLSSFFGLGGDGYICKSTGYYGPHNSVLLLLVNWGLIPSLGFIGISTYLLLSVIKTKKRFQRMMGINLLVGIAYSLVSSVFDNALSQLMAIIALALFWCSYKKMGNTSCCKWRSVPHQIIILICICSVYFVAEQMYTRWDRYEILTVNEQLKPKFWLGLNCPQSLQPPFINAYHD
ncbi:O-antigen ligase family protein [Vibrio aestuarianus]|uniref:O-antigen ligase family protein n=1 Tax=Vibrio aestuarianus TaxID=28171 RepID=UPI0021C37432|nr:O-antigen ligase family protein [Vibrio aestuarianus]MDE1317118.1 O-antigen ligase family protein [Vibrio aestuarianus]CAH8198752.1 conserved membrane hypothetical protein [Vibrio aestuarianus]